MLRNVQFRNVSPVVESVIHPYYHFHGFAGGQLADDSKFMDMAGMNDAVRGDNLSIPQLWTTNPGYASTIDPISGATNSVLRIPAINYDYNGGETLIVHWVGKATFEASQQHIIGDGYSTSVHGWAITSNSTGKMQIILSGATQGWSGTSAGVVFDGTLHSFGVVLDGQNKRYAMWVDDALDANFVGYLSFNSGNLHDTKTMNTVNIGASSPAPGGTSGIATATRSLAILRLPVDHSVPDEATMTTVFRQLRANPGRLILAGAF